MPRARRLFGPFVSGLKIPFPGNTDLGSKRLGSNACFSVSEDRAFSRWHHKYSKAATFQAILNFLLANVEWFDMYVEDDYGPSRAGPRAI
jgi:hypothetical protein